MKRHLLAAVAAISLAIAPGVATARPYTRHHAVHHYMHRRHYPAYAHRYRSSPHSDADQGFGIGLGPLFGFHADRHGFGFHVGPLGLSTHGVVVGGRPAGCPHAYCGCGTSLYFFGHEIGSLNLAANWLRFPHVAPQAGVAAVAPSRHHVLAVVRHVAGMNFEVHDSNSGGGLTRNHVRNLAGYTFVNPRV